MADKAAEVTVVKSADEVPGGVQPQGESPEEAMKGLYEALGSEEDFEDPESENSPTGKKGKEDDEAKKAEKSEKPKKAGSESEDEDDEEDADEADDESDEDEDDEDESDDDGDDADDDQEALSDDTEIEGVPLPGGETTKVTLKELKAGYSRQADYTRKTQALAEEHRQGMAEVREIREQYSTRLDQVNEILSKLGPQKPDPALRQQNAGEYAAQMADYQAFQDSLKAITSAKDAVAAEMSQEDIDARQAHVHQEWGKLVAAVPEWSDHTVATKDLTALRQFAIESYGFAPEEIDSVTDSRLLLMLRANFNLTQTQAEAKEKVEEKKAEAKERLKPGSRKTQQSAKSKKRKAQRAADRRAQTSGSVSDAARAIELALGDED